MSEPPVDPGPFVTLAQMADFLKAPSYATGPEAPILQEVLDAALENVISRVGPLDSAARIYVVYPSGRCLVLPDTHLVSVGPVTDPAGNVISADQLDCNLLSGIVTVPSVRAGQWTVEATSREHASSIRLAIKIIASHLWDTQRGSPSSGNRPGFGQPVTDGSPVRMGFAIPARAAELLAPFARGQ